MNLQQQQKRSNQSPQSITPINHPQLAPTMSNSYLNIGTMTGVTMITMTLLLRYLTAPEETPLSQHYKPLILTQFSEQEQFFSPPNSMFFFSIIIGMVFFIVGLFENYFSNGKKFSKEIYNERHSLYHNYSPSFQHHHHRGEAISNILGLE